MGIHRDGRGQPDPYVVSTSERCRYHGSWYGETPGDVIDLSVQVLQSGVVYTTAVCESGTVGTTIEDSGTFSADVDVPADTTFSHRVRIRRNGIAEVSSSQSFKSVAMAVEFQSLAVSNPQQTSIDFSGQWKPNTNESTATAYLYYKKTTDPGWTLWGNSGPQSGTGWKTYTATVTGLTEGTSYQFRLSVTRTVSNSLWAGEGTTIVYGGVTYGFLPNADETSSTVSLSTLTLTPTITTESATAVTSSAGGGSARMNGTANASSLPGGIDCTFEWNVQAYRKVEYTGVNVTDGKVLTLGSQVYHFEDPVSATGSVDFTGQPNPTESLTISVPGGDTSTYTFVAAVAVAGDVKIGASADATFTNLMNAINNTGGTPGVGGDYLPYGGAANTMVSASFSNASVPLTALLGGPAGNDIDLSDDASSNAFSVTAMSGGLDLPGNNDYEVAIGATSDDTMLNLEHAVNKSGGTEGVDYSVVAAHPYLVARRVLEGFVELVIETNVNPTLTFTTDEPTFSLTADLEDPWVRETNPAENITGNVTTPFSVHLLGDLLLDARHGYFYRAKGVYTAGGGGTLYGDTVLFVVPGIPGVLAEEEEHMQTIQFDGHYNQSKTVTCSLREPASSSSDIFYTGTAPVAADILLFKDGVYSGTATNGMTRVNNYLYTLVLTAGEMSCEILDVIIHDASGTAFRDAHLQIRTAQRLSQLVVDATDGPTDASAITAIGNDDGHGIFASSTGGGSDINAVLASMWLRVALAQAGGGGSEIKLDTNASPTNDFYNDTVVVLLSGTGAGQARVITGYNGSNRTATVDSAWSTAPDATTLYAIGAGTRVWRSSPAAELATLPGPTASYGAMMQLLFQRFAFKIEQTASAQTWYDSAGNPLFDRAVSDDGVTQTVEALAAV